MRRLQICREVFLFQRYTAVDLTHVKFAFFAFQGMVSQFSVGDPKRLSVDLRCGACKTASPSSTASIGLGKTGRSGTLERPLAPDRRMSTMILAFTAPSLLVLTMSAIRCTWPARSVRQSARFWQLCGVLHMH